MSSLSKNDVDDVREIFDLFDFWDGRDGAVDAAKVIDIARCSEMNPTIEFVCKQGGKRKFGEKAYKFDEFLPIYETVIKEKDCGTLADFTETFKTLDREGHGFISLAEVRHVLAAMGERLSEKDLDDIFNFTETKADNDGNIKYEDFVKKVMGGSVDKK